MPLSGNWGTGYWCIGELVIGTGVAFDLVYWLLGNWKIGKIVIRNSKIVIPKSKIVNPKLVY